VPFYLSAQCFNSGDYLAGPSLAAPRFGNIRVQVPDAGRGALFASQGVEPGDRVRVGTSRSDTYDVASNNAFVSIERAAEVSMNSPSLNHVVDMFVAPSYFDIFVQPRSCADIGGLTSTGWNGITVSCRGCEPIHPTRPEPILNDGIDSLGLVVGKRYDTDTYFGPQDAPSLLPFENYGAEYDAWVRKNPIGNPNSATTLNDVYRSPLKPIEGGVTQTKLTIDLTNVEFNTSTYAGRRTGGIGVSVIEYNRTTDSYRAIAATYVTPLSGSIFSTAVVDLPYPIRCQGGAGSCGASNRVHYLSFWTVASLLQIQGFETANFLYQGNVARFDIGVSGQATPYPTPPNDECAGATLLIPSATCQAVAVPFRGATNSGTDANGCMPGDEIWLTFAATSTMHEFSFTPRGNWSVNYELLAGDCAGGFTSLACGSPFSDPVLENLTIGDTYYLRVRTGTSGGDIQDIADVCLFGPMTNCFVPEAVFDTTICQDLDSMILFLDVLFVGDAAGANLVDDVSNDVLGVVSATGSYELTVATGVRRLRLESLDGVCIGDDIFVNSGCNSVPVSNDECTGAYPLFANSVFTPLDDLVWRNATLRLTTPPANGFPGDCAAPGQDKDGWLKYTNNTDRTTNVSILTQKVGNPGELVLNHFIYRGDCGNLAYDFCTNEYAFLIENVGVGETVYIQVRLESNEFANFGENFRMAAYDTPPPPNGTAATATVLVPSDNPDCTEIRTTAGDPDQVTYYRFTAASTNVAVAFPSVLSVIPYN